VVGFGPVGQGVAARARDLGAVVTVVDLATHQPVKIAFSKDRKIFSQSIAWTNRDDELYVTILDKEVNQTHLATLNLDGKLTDVPQTDDARWVVPSPDGAFISTESVRSELVLIENL